MQDKVFIDTNILVYAFSEDEKNKQIASMNIFEQYSSLIIISNQVINELVNVLFKKFRVPAQDIENAILEIDNEVNIASFTLTTQIKAIKIKEKYKLQYYDALIVATAIENGCKTLFTEDMQNGQIIENMQIVNPFK